MESRINQKIMELSAALAKLQLPRNSLPEWVRVVPDLYCDHCGGPRCPKGWPTYQGHSMGPQWNDLYRGDEVRLWEHRWRLPEYGEWQGYRLIGFNGSN